jgi:ubiquitin carboxyl-terminal hydrolase 14
MHQDAAECWNVIMSAVKGPPSDLFRIEFRTRQLESSGKPLIESDAMLTCEIGSETRRIEQGICLESEISNDDGSFRKIKREIAKFPRYLAVHMLRFCYKSYEETSAKIVRRVDHSFRLDTLNWVTPELRSVCVALRETNKNNDAGFYGLKAIITHRGRACDSGHYVAHVFADNQWYRFDDEKVTAVEVNDIALLNGSGDWHCSYILVYEACAIPDLGL